MSRDSELSKTKGSYTNLIKQVKTKTKLRDEVQKLLAAFTDPHVTCIADVAKTGRHISQCPFVKWTRDGLEREGCGRNHGKPGCYGLRRSHLESVSSTIIPFDISHVGERRGRVETEENYPYNTLRDTTLPQSDRELVGGEDKCSNIKQDVSISADFVHVRAPQDRLMLGVQGSGTHNRRSSTDLEKNCPWKASNDLKTEKKKYTRTSSKRHISQNVSQMKRKEDSQYDTMTAPPPNNKNSKLSEPTPAFSEVQECNKGKKNKIPSNLLIQIVFPKGDVEGARRGNKLEEKHDKIEVVVPIAREDTSKKGNCYNFTEHHKNKAYREKSSVTANGISSKSFVVKKKIEESDLILKKPIPTVPGARSILEKLSQLSPISEENTGRSLVKTSTDANSLTEEEYSSNSGNILVIDKRKGSQKISNSGRKDGIPVLPGKVKATAVYQRVDAGSGKRLKKASETLEREDRERKIKFISARSSAAANKHDISTPTRRSGCKNTSTTGRNESNECSENYDYTSEEERAGSSSYETSTTGSEEFIAAISNSQTDRLGIERSLSDSSACLAYAQPGSNNPRRIQYSYDEPYSARKETKKRSMLADENAFQESQKSSRSTKHASLSKDSSACDDFEFLSRIARKLLQYCEPASILEEYQKLSSKKGGAMTKTVSTSELGKFDSQENTSGRLQNGRGSKRYAPPTAQIMSLERSEGGGKSRARSAQKGPAKHFQASEKPAGAENCAKVFASQVFFYENRNSEIPGLCEVRHGPANVKLREKARREVIQAAHSESEDTPMDEDVMNYILNAEEKLLQREDKRTRTENSTMRNRMKHSKNPSKYELVFKR